MAFAVFCDISTDFSCWKRLLKKGKHYNQIWQFSSSAVFFCVCVFPFEMLICPSLKYMNYTVTGELERRFLSSSVFSPFLSHTETTTTKTSHINLARFLPVFLFLLSIDVFTNYIK